MNHCYFYWTVLFCRVVFFEDGRNLLVLLIVDSLKEIFVDICFSLSMVIMWTCGDIFKTLYFFLREAPKQFWMCGLIQVTVDTLILLQVYIYKNNTEPQRIRPHRGDWVVIIWTHEENDHNKAKCNDELAVINETIEEKQPFGDRQLRDSASFNGDVRRPAIHDGTDSESGGSERKAGTVAEAVVSADVHNDGGTVPNGDSAADVDVVHINGDCAKDKRNVKNVSYKKRAKRRVNMLIHRHTLWHPMSGGGHVPVLDVMHVLFVLQEIVRRFWKGACDYRRPVIALMERRSVLFHSNVRCLGFYFRKLVLFQQQLQNCFYVFCT